MSRFADEIVEAFVEIGAAERVTLIVQSMGRVPDLQIYVEDGGKERPVNLGLKKERLVAVLKRDGARVGPEMRR